MKNSQITNWLSLGCLLALQLFGSVSKAQVGKYVVLNGINNYYEVPDHSKLDYTGNVLSIECWVKMSCDDGVILSKQICSGQNAYYLRINNGVLQWTFSKDGYCNTIHSFKSDSAFNFEDEFVHIAVSHTKTKVQLFVNGKAITGSFTLGSFGNVHNSSEPLRIGAYVAKSGARAIHYSGYIDELRFWDIEFTESMLQANMSKSLSASTSNLFLNLSMNDNTYGSSARLANSSSLGSSYNAVVKGYSGNSPYTESSETTSLLQDSIISCNSYATATVQVKYSSGILWYDGSTSVSKTIWSNGTYTVEATLNKCNVIYDTFYVELFKRNYDSFDKEICEGDSFLFKGTWYKSAGSFQQTVSGNGADCDTIYTVTMDVLQRPTRQFNVTICSGDSAQISGIWYKSAGNFQQNISANGTGCDTVYKITVQLKTLPSKSDEFSICDGDSIQINSSWYKNQGNFQQTILGQGTHCDTTYYITIKLLPKPTKSLSFQICEGDSISVYGTWYRWQGLFEQTVSGSLGDCDSTFYIAIGVKSKSQSEIIIDTCQFSKIHFLGQEIFAGSEKYFKFTNHVGCDSILKVKVEANKILYGSQTIASCSTVTYLGKEYEPNSTTNIVFSSAEGCDSVVTLKIIPGNQQTSFLGSDLKVCQPTTALIGLDDKTTWSTGEVSRSIVVSKSGAYSARYKAADGCEHYDEIFVRFIDKSMYIPSAFSPNSDLLNECWKPVFAHPDEVSDYKLYIYNRLGLLVFETDDVNACWDGKYKGETCQNTLFLWIVQGTSIECGVIDERCGYMRINR